VTLPYVEQGDPAGIPVLLLHGVTDSLRSFEGVLPYLPPNIHAFALTQRGHGDADRPQIGYLMRDFAADVAAFMDEVGLEVAVIAGSSMGSSVAQRFAIDYPERVIGLVLMAAFFNYLENPAVVEFWEQGVAPLTDPIDPAFAREFQESTLAKPIAPAMLDMVVAESLKVPAHVWKGVFKGILENDDSAEVSRITAPTLILWGDQDAFAPRRDQDALVGAIANSRLIVYEGHGHATHWEDPERTARDIVTFVAEIIG
jgi:pimeloyl-ACP methyl ester carboxylesterase